MSAPDYLFYGRKTLETNHQAVCCAHHWVGFTPGFGERGVGGVAGKGRELLTFSTRLPLARYDTGGFSVTAHLRSLDRQGNRDSERLGNLSVLSHTG